MSKVYVFLAEGFEEIEALMVVDLLRRAKIDVSLVSIMEDLYVTSSRRVTVKADMLFKDIDSSATMVVLPGGLPGMTNLKAHSELMDMVRKFAASTDKYVAAICAAPSILGDLGLVDGKSVTSYPGYDDSFKNSNYVTDRVCVDGNIITSRGMGTTMDFGLKLIEILANKDLADTVARKTMYIY